MDRKKPKSKLRKEDIGTPVNFVHIQHIGKNGTRNAQGSFSASASPTSIQCDPFFDVNFRRSDSSMCSTKGRHLDHRLSSAVQRRPSNPPPLPPHGSSMSDLSLINNDPEGSFDPRMSSHAPEKPLPQKPLKASFTGSLLNLSFLQFGKTEKSRNGDNLTGSHRNEPLKGNRLSLSMLNTSNALPSSFPAPMRPIPDLPSPSPPPFAHITRRRSSSFSGAKDFRYSEGAVEADVNCGRHSAPLSSSSTEQRSQFSFDHSAENGRSKKFKLQRAPSQVTPPMSPSYDELPPPPPFDEDVDMTYTDHGQEIKPLPPTQMAALGNLHNDMFLPESPTYEELPPPPQFDLNAPPKYNSLSRSASIRLETVNLRKNKVSAPCLPNRHQHIQDLGLSSGEKVGISALQEVRLNILQVADLRPHDVIGTETSSFRPSTFKPTNNKLPAWRSKVVRVNAPTLPPLCVPFMQGNQYVDSSPEVWPLQPAPYVISQFPSHDQKPDRPESDEPVYAVPIKHPDALDPLRMPNLDLIVESTHLKPLSKVFQTKVSYKDWPFVMEYLLASASSSNEAQPSADIDRIYGEVIEKTLELWLKLHGTPAPLYQEVALAFQQVPNSSTLPSAELPPGTGPENIDV